MESCEKNVWEVLDTLCPVGGGGETQHNPLEIIC